MIAVALLLLSGCQESLEDRAAREVVEYTQKYCPQKLKDFTTLDSLTFDKATLTFTQYLTLSGNADNAGAKYVQDAVSTTFGVAGPVFITVAMALFAFTTLLGNLYYVRNALAFLNGKKKPGEKFMKVFHVICALVVLVGAVIPMAACWDLADITMAGMTLINLPACVILGKVAINALKDYECQRKVRANPQFSAKNVGLENENLDYWKA